MTFKADEKIMEMIWETLPKTKDGRHVRFTDDDVALIWWNGFVDTIQYPEESWKGAFQPHKQTDGTYLLTKEEFIEKERFRYTGEIRIPFEPMLINEGQYTEEGLEELIDLSIAPSCYKTRAELKKFFDEFKERFREGNLIRMNKDGKREIQELVNTYPSPLRRLEIIYDIMFMQQIAAAEAGLLEVVATPEQAAKAQMSTFADLPGSESEKAAVKLKDLQKIRKKTEPKATGSGDEGVQVKKIRKSRKGFKG